MAENAEKAENEKRELTHIAGNKPDDGKEYLHTNIGFDRSSDTKYEIYWLLPVTGIRTKLEKLSEECKERYDCDLVALIESGVRQLTTRPDYKGVGFNENGTLKENGHEFMQQMADNYKVGARTTGTGVKAKAQKHDQLVARYGTEEDIEAKLAKYEELKAKGLI